ncbi:MAG: hypothetical protein FWB96_00635 [Defluviitaleaceae bacterium]|nr:hypothetical protein [Defluviitaleaceae bacterium]MCL2264165.1 hypothetical protein [Defluviitaleaceae bacterium]
MKKILILVVAVILGAAVLGAAIAAGLFFFWSDRTEPAVAVVTEIPPAGADLPPAQQAARLGLPGEWDWLGVPYYIFDTDGFGARNTGETWQIFQWWRGDGGVIFMCETPDTCNDRCLEPVGWYYQIDGDTLTLAHILMPQDWVFTYTRGEISYNDED